VAAALQGDGGGQAGHTGPGYQNFHAYPILL